MALFFGISLLNILGKIIDLLLVLSILYAVFVFGKCRGYSDGQINGYLMGYESFYQKAYFHLVDSLNAID